MRWKHIVLAEKFSLRRYLSSGWQCQWGWTVIKSNVYYCAGKFICNYGTICLYPSLSLSLSFPLPAIDLLYGGIYCFVCQDYIYDKEMEQIAKEEQRKAWKLQGITFRFLSESLMQLLKRGNLISHCCHICVSFYPQASERNTQHGSQPRGS